MMLCWEIKRLRQRYKIHKTVPIASCAKTGITDPMKIQIRAARGDIK